MVRIEKSSHPIHIVMRVGSVMAMLETATGRVFSAFLPRNVVTAALASKLDRLGIGYAGRASIDIAGTEAMLADVRKRGITRAIGDPLPGVNAFAAPVFDHTGAVVLSITAMGTAGSFNADWNSPIAKALLDCTHAISRRLGHASHRPPRG